MNFDEESLTLLDEITSQDVLFFKSNKTGNIIKAKPEDTLLDNMDLGKIHSVSKYKNTLRTIFWDPTNPLIVYTNGCPKCKRKIVRYMRSGEDKRTFYQCRCKATWSN